MAGRFTKVAEEVGVGLPSDYRRTATGALEGFLALPRSDGGRARRLACKTLARYRRTGKVADAAR